MKYIKYRKRKDSDDCITKCPYGLDKMVGSLACEACHYHYLKMVKTKEVICEFEDRHNA